MISIILGMGMPTTAVYVLLATLIAPSLIESGVPKMAAHMFILYFGMLSMITPPVALAAFAAANISKAGRDGDGVGGLSHRLGQVRAAVHVRAVADAADDRQARRKCVYDFVTAFARRLLSCTVGIVGFFQDRVGWPKRILLIVIGGVAAVPQRQRWLPDPCLPRRSRCDHRSRGVLAVDYFNFRRSASATA